MSADLLIGHSKGINMTTWLGAKKSAWATIINGTVTLQRTLWMDLLGQCWMGGAGDPDSGKEGSWVQRGKP